jgi:hypothetical protein
MKKILLATLMVLPFMAKSQFNGPVWSAWEDCSNPGRNFLEGLNEAAKISSVTLRVYAADCRSAMAGCDFDQDSDWPGHPLSGTFEEYIWMFDEKGQMVFSSECAACDATPGNNKYKIKSFVYDSGGHPKQVISKDSVPESGILKIRIRTLNYDAGGRIISEILHVEGLSDYKYRFQYPSATRSQTWLTDGLNPEFLQKECTLDEKGRIVTQQIHASPKDKSMMKDNSWFHPENCTFTEYHENGKIKSIRTSYCGATPQKDNYIFEYDSLGRVTKLEGLVSLTAKYDGTTPWVAEYKETGGVQECTRIIRETDPEGNPRILYLTKHQDKGYGTPFHVLSRKYVFETKYRE